MRKHTYKFFVLASHSEHYGGLKKCPVKDKWCHENIPDNDWCVECSVDEKVKWHLRYWFRHEEDAMAFKLVWTGNDN